MPLPTPPSDKAEKEEELAFQANVAGVDAIARAAERHGARLIHISTDYVFDGTKGHPYRPDDPTSPLSAYGRTKLGGEEAALAACRNCLVVRTAWLYGDQGSNFVKTMLRVMSSHPQVRVVCDQIGTPTYAGPLAQALWTLARTDSRGVLHYTDSGVASWYDFACAIQEEALALGLLEKAVPVLPISTAEYPLPAPRPSFSILDKAETSALLGAPRKPLANQFAYHAGAFEECLGFLLPAVPALSARTLFVIGAVRMPAMKSSYSMPSLMRAGARIWRGSKI